MIRAFGAAQRRRIVLAVLIACGAACDAPRDPIIVEGGIISIENQTDVEWKNVIVTVNDHFSGGVPSLAPGGRISEPFGKFQTAFGQKFDTGRQSVFKVEVTATDPTGKPIKLAWGHDKK